MAKIKSFSDRLNLSLDKLGFPPKHCGRIQRLSEMVGLSHRGAGKWVNGQSSPPLGKFSTLAKQLQVNEHWLLTGEGPMCADQNESEQAALGHLQDIPMYEMDQIRSPNKQPYQSMTCILPYISDFFAFVLQTEAMSPRFPIGSILILDAGANPKDGDFVLAIDEAYPEPVFRQLLKTNSALYLHAHHPNFDRLRLETDTHVLGKLVQAIVSFE